MADTNNNLKTLYPGSDPNLEIAQELKGFFINKTIQKNYTFQVSFQNLRAIDFTKDPMPHLEPYHILDVSFPTYTFKKESIPTGLLPTHYPIFQGEGMDITITLEEDKKGTVQRFINWCQRTIITPEGLINPPNITKLLLISIKIMNDRGIELLTYNFDRCFFLGADPSKFDYHSGSNSMKYALSFCSDYYIATRYNATVDYYTYKGN